MNTSTSTILSSILIHGDLSKLNEEQKTSYYTALCERVGLNPLSHPFKLLRLNGREVLYCDRTGAQQLNKLHGVSHIIVARETFNGCYVVTAQASTPEGRRTESIGAVPVENLKGDNLCNAIMKAETKAKRRATLDLLGLGLLDDTEIGSIPGAHKIAKEPVTPAESVTTKNPEPVSPFKVTYTASTDISNQVNAATEIAHLASLYIANADLIETTPYLKNEFTARKNHFLQSA